MPKGTVKFTEKIIFLSENIPAMVVESISLILALLTLYNTTVLNSYDKRRERISQELSGKALSVLNIFLLISVVFFVLAIVQSYNLLTYFNKKEMVISYVHEIVLVLFLIPTIYTSYLVISGSGSGNLKNLSPQINLQNLLVVQGFAVLWLYLNTLNDKFPQIASVIALSLNGVFIISIVLSIYVMWLIIKYHGMVRKGMILEHLDFYPLLIKVNLALSLFGFAILSKTSQNCYIVICNSLLAGHAIVMNHTLSELGRGIKKLIGM